MIGAELGNRLAPSMEASSQPLTRPSYLPSMVPGEDCSQLSGPIFVAPFLSSSDVLKLILMLTAHI